MITGFIIYCSVGLTNCNTLISTRTFPTIESCQENALVAKEQLESNGLVFVGEVCYILGENA